MKFLVTNIWVLQHFDFFSKVLFHASDLSKHPKFPKPSLIELNQAAVKSWLGYTYQTQYHCVKKSVFEYSGPQFPVFRPNAGKHRPQ